MLESAGEDFEDHKALAAPTPGRSARLASRPRGWWKAPRWVQHTGKGGERQEGGLLAA